MGIFQYECMVSAATPPKNVGCETCPIRVGPGGVRHLQLHIAGAVEKLPTRQCRGSCMMQCIVFFLACL